MLTKKITTAIATGAVLLNALAPMAFADTVVVSGNGDSSSNGVTLQNHNDTTVNQTNNTSVSNNVVSSASTGGNSASRNTGGNTSVDTGNANSTVNVSTTGGINQADVANCGCQNNTGVLVSGNGVDSSNGVTVNSGNNTTLNQTNNTSIANSVNSKASTGYNDANRNTGGSSSVTTGDAKSDVSVTNTANVNVAHVGNGGSAGSAGGNSPEVLITGNGDSSDNGVTLLNHSNTTLNQTNSASISNDVWSSAKTGDNDANRNTGGNVSIDTGNATAKAHITNEPNFNVASFDNCGCASNTFLKIAGNGVDSDNGITADTGSAFTLNNTNNLALRNDAYPTAKTGNNDANRNTGAVIGIDPVNVMTGDAMDDVTVTNGGNTNTFGPNATLGLPGLGNVSFSSDFSSFWAAWMSFVSSHQS